MTVAHRSAAILAILDAVQAPACGSTKDRSPEKAHPATGGAGGVSGTGGAPGAPPIAGTVVSIDAGAPSAPGCVREQVHFERELPNVMLLVDGSSSMSIPDFDADLRWEAVKHALIDEDSGLVATLQDRVRFGLTIFFSTARSGEPAAACPVLERVPVALDNLDAVAVALKDVWPRGSTPTGESIEHVYPELAALDPVAFRGPRILILATDGEPTGCYEGDREAARERSKSAVDSAYAAGVQSYVIGVGAEASDDHLRELANLGQGLPAEAPESRFYRVLDTQQLSDALSAIAGDVQGCVFDLNGTVAENAADRGTVTLDGVPLTHDDPDGWHLLGPNQLSVDGAACEQIQAATDLVLDISFPCGLFVPS
jgi:hypothetical protein